MVNDFEDDMYEWIGDISKEEIVAALEDDKKIRKHTLGYFNDRSCDPSFDFHMKEVLEKKGREKGYDNKRMNPGVYCS